MDAYFNRAKIKEQLGDLNGALQDYSTVLKYNSNEGEAYYYRWFVLEKKGIAKAPYSHSSSFRIDLINCKHSVKSVLFS